MDSSERSRAVTVSIIGAGRLGTALAIALGRHGYLIQAMVARRISHARAAAKLLAKTVGDSGCPAPATLALSSGELHLLPRSRLLLITTPDDLISTTAMQIAVSAPVSRRWRIALHASGALSSEALSNLRKLNFQVGSMHPLVAISEPLAGAESLCRSYYCVEGDRGAVSFARSVVRRLGARSFSIGARHKALYHTAAVLASGHLVALVDLATEMLEECGLTRSRARQVLVPLVRSTVENLSSREPATALTGSFARADLATVRRHLEALRSLEASDAMPVYVLLGQRSLELARRKGAPEASLKAIAAELVTMDKLSSSAAPRGRATGRTAVRGKPGKKQ